MKQLGSVLVLTITASIAQAAPSTVLHILKNGHVRFEDGPELNVDQFKEELRRRSAEKSLTELTLGLEQKPDYSAIAAVLAEMQNSGVKIGFMVGPAQ
jgi:biopolymer transport protein ExbD